MNTEIIVALIAAAASIIVAIFTAKKAAKDTGNQVSDTISQKLQIEHAVMNTKIEELTREVREHNGFARRMPVVEEKIDALEKRVESIENKIN